MVSKRKVVNKRGWRLTSYNPLTKAVISTNEFNSIKEIADKYKILNEDAWRSLSIGRSKVYEPFFKLEHLKI